MGRPDGPDRRVRPCCHRSGEDGDQLRQFRGRGRTALLPPRLPDGRRAAADGVPHQRAVVVRVVGHRRRSPQAAASVLDLCRDTAARKVTAFDTLFGATLWGVIAVL